MSQQTVIDSLAFAREGAVLEGNLRVAGLERLHDQLTQVDGELSFRLEGRLVGREKTPELLLSVRGGLSLRCQRCLGGLPHQVQVDSVLELIESEDDLTQEDLEDDSRDFLPAQKDLDVAGLVEEEVLLDLPVAPRHESCVMPEAAVATEKASPFAALAALKGKTS